MSWRKNDGSVTWGSPRRKTGSISATPGGGSISGPTGLTLSRGSCGKFLKSFSTFIMAALSIDRFYQRYLQMLMSIRRLFQNKHSLEFIPLVFILSLLPFLHGGVSGLAKGMFLAFPILYLPVIIRRHRSVTHSFYLVISAWILFLSMNFLSSLSSISLSLSLPKLFELLGFFLYFVLFHFAVVRRSDLTLLSYSIVIVGFSLSVISLFFIFSPPRSIPGMNLVYATFGHNRLSDYLTFVIPLMIVMFLRQKKKLSTLICGALAVFFFISLYLTFARAAFLIVSFMTVVLVWLYRPSFQKVSFLLVLTLIPLLLTLGYVASSRTQMGSRFITSVVNESLWLQRQVIKPVQNDRRFEFWREAYEGFQTRPLLGNGPGTFRLTSKRYSLSPGSYSWFAHNSLLQIASESGSLGLLAYGVLLIMIFSQFRLRTELFQNSSSFALPLLLASSGSFAQSLVDFNFDFPAISLIFWAVMASLLKLLNRQQAKVSSFRISKILLIVSLACVLFVVSALVSNLFFSLAKRNESFSPSQAGRYYRLAVLFPSFDITRSLSFLQFVDASGRKEQVALLENLLASWNSEDPAVLAMLAKIHEPAPQALSYYKKTFSVSSPLDKVSLVEPMLRLDDSDSDLAVNLFLDILTHYRLISSEQQHETITPGQRKIMARYISAFYDPAISDLTQIRWWASKVFYFTGLDLIQNGEIHDASSFWDWARLISPDWDYYQIEAASYQYHVLRDSNQARAVLEECLSNEYTKESCLNQLRMGVALLPEPGSYRDRIAEIAYK